MAEQMRISFENNLKIHYWDRLWKSLKLEGKRNIFNDISKNNIEHELNPGKKPTLEALFRATAKMQEIIKKHGKRIFSLIPLTRSHIPNFIVLDTLGLYELFGKELRISREQAFDDHRKKLWTSIFQFKHTSGDFGFHYRILTNGVQLNIIYSKVMKKNANNSTENKKQIPKGKFI